ncbi:unnamed protein product [Chrysoparadoxa australica]
MLASSRMFALSLLCATASAFTLHMTTTATPPSSVPASNIVPTNSGDKKSASSSIVPAGSAGGLGKRENFDRVLDSLGDKDKYNAVLQGLAQMAMTSGRSGSAEEIDQLLDEMVANKITCLEGSASAVIDAATASTDTERVSSIMSKIRRIGAGQKYARDLAKLSLFPRDPVRRKRSLEKAPTPPEDSRVSEMAQAGAFLGVVGIDLVGDGMAPVMHYDNTIPMVLSAVTALAVVWDVVQSKGGKTREVVSGLNRLFLRDVERESRAEAGALLAAYLTGLPCFAFRPNAVEAVRMMKSGESMEGLATPQGVHNVLVWLLAAVAGEALQHRQCIVSDPRQAQAFLQLMREQGVEGLDLEPGDDQDRIKWAYKEAREILRENEAIFDALRVRLETGGATAGECVSVIEKSVQPLAL